MQNTLRPTFLFLLLLTLLFGVVYPGVSTLLIRTFFPAEANGSLIIDKDGKPLGSALIGQNFSKPEYFWGRLSATGPVPYNAAASTGSNLGSNNPALKDAVKARVDTLKAADLANTRPIPVDLVTASGSGLDPHISPAAAEYQVARVAQARGKTVAEVRQIVARFTEGRQFDLLGEPRVNVLKLNLALDGKIP
jgi:K+-transporting ATPase ATPase C chain